MSPTKHEPCQALPGLFPWRSPDHRVASATRLLLEAIGRELAALAERLADVYESAFVETAESRRWLRPLVAALALGVAVAIGIACRERKRGRSRLARPSG